MGRVERQQKAREEMRTAITRAAMKLFLKRGFEETSMRKIAEEIGYAPGSLYSYFKDKDEILYALHNEGFDKLYAMQQGCAGVQDPKKRLLRCGEVYVQFALENPEYYDLMFITRATARKIEEDQEWAGGLRAYEVLRNNIAACMDAGLLPKGDIEVASFAVWSFVHGMASLVIRGRCVMFEEKDLESMMRKALRFMVESLMPA